MKKILLVLSMLLTMVFVYSQAPDTWTRKADFGGGYRSGAAGFSINNKGYIGTGQDDNNINEKDFWEYDPSTDTWSQRADFGGGLRLYAVGFSIGNKGYIGTGYDGVANKRDFWEYDLVANTWTRKADFGGNDRYIAVGFSIGSKGYIGIGYNRNRYQKDFWEYNPASDTWVQKADFGGGLRGYAVGFSIGNKGYIGTGYDGVANKTDFWEYNPASDTWTQKANFGGTARQGAVGFSIGSKGYVGTGYAGFSIKDFWEYSPASDTWIQKADFGGGLRVYAVGFSIGNKEYIGTGFDGRYSTKDFWEYTPEEDTGCQPPIALKVPFISDTTAVLKWTLPINPVNGFDIVYHIIGSTRVYKRHVTGTTTHIAIGNLQHGTIYRWKIRSDCTADTTKWINGPDFTTSLAISSLNAAAVKGNNVSVQIIPNPNKGNFTIQMQLPSKAALTTLSVYNNLGVMIWQQNAGILSGSVNRNIELKSKLPTGVYVLMIQEGAIRLKQKFVVTK